MNPAAGVPDTSPAAWHMVVPGDPDQRTGGYNYVRRVTGALAALGQPVITHGLAGRFPQPDAVAGQAMQELLAGLPDRATVILDGLAMGAMPDVLKTHQARLRLIALVHHPLADESGLSEGERQRLETLETAALETVTGVITTSGFTARRLADFWVAPDRIRVVTPGVDRRTPQVRSNTAEPRLLCVASLTPRKAQQQLVSALASLRDLPWQCTLVGSPERAPAYARGLARQIDELGLSARITLAGELSDDALDRAFRQADGFVLPSLYEGYGMVIDEALSYGLPVISSDGGALAQTADRPGVRQYPAGDDRALARALSTWLSRPDALDRDRRAAARTRDTLHGWTQRAQQFQRAVSSFTEASVPNDGSVFDAHWLSLREPADHRARSEHLTNRLQHWLDARPAATGAVPVRLDIGSGTGSNGRYLIPRIGGEHWVLLDQDSALLARAARALSETGHHSARDLVIETVSQRLSGSDFQDQIPESVELITASALIDLVSADWLGALARVAADRQCALLIVLSYSGEVSLAPVHPDDGTVLAAVNQHQHRDKGEGAALGPEATDCLCERLQALGYAVETDDSPWHLDHRDCDLQAALIKGWSEAAVEQAPALIAVVRAWRHERLAQARAGQLTIRVGHRDLLALPPGGGCD